MSVWESKQIFHAESKTCTELPLSTIQHPFLLVGVLMYNRAWKRLFEIYTITIYASKQRRLVIAISSCVPLHTWGVQLPRYIIIQMTRVPISHIKRPITSCLTAYVDDAIPAAASAAQCWIQLLFIRISVQPRCHAPNDDVLVLANMQIILPDGVRVLFSRLLITSLKFGIYFHHRYSTPRFLLTYI